jgi:DNA-directed RNA polymerase specialized sigma24 family protein
VAPYQATAEVFMTAFKSLPVRERSTFLKKLLEDNSLREDIMDIAVATKRSHEKTKPFRVFHQ